MSPPLPPMRADLCRLLPGGCSFRLPSVAPARSVPSLVPQRWRRGLVGSVGSRGAVGHSDQSSLLSLAACKKPLSPSRSPDRALARLRSRYSPKSSPHIPIPDSSGTASANPVLAESIENTRRRPTNGGGRVILSISRPRDRTARLDYDAAPSEFSRPDARRVRAVLTRLPKWVDEASQEDAGATRSEPLRSRARTVTQRGSLDPPPDVRTVRGVPGIPGLRQALRELQKVGTRYYWSPPSSPDLFGLRARPHGPHRPRGPGVILTKMNHASGRAGGRNSPRSPPAVRRLGRFQRSDPRRVSGRVAVSRRPVLVLLTAP